MSDQSESIIGEETRQTAKIVALKQRLQEDLAKTNASDNEKKIVEALFNKAPADFIDRTEVNTLVDIAQDACTHYNKFHKQNKSVLVRLINYPSNSPRGKFTGLLTAMGDRSFIIDTLSEFLRVNHLPHYVLLHPIIQSDNGKRTSLVYVELERISDDKELKTLEERLTAVFRDLLLVHEDFSPMLVRSETSARIVESGIASTQFSEDKVSEVSDFLRWLSDGNFIFLGYQEWVVDPRSKNAALEAIEESRLGIFRSTNNDYVDDLKETELDAKYLLSQESLVHVTKSLIESPVHRRARMDVITLKIPSTDGTISKIACFMGLVTSKAISQNALSVPLIRRKLNTILNRESLAPNSHDYKEIVSIVDSLSKSELFFFDVDTLHREVSMIMSIQRRSEIRASFHVGPLKRFMTLLVAMPRERFSSTVRTKIQNYVEKLMSVPEGASEYRLAVLDDSLIIIHFLIPNTSQTEVTLDPLELEEKIRELTLTWDDQLFTIIASTSGNAAASQLLEFYSRVLPEQYKAATSALEASRDVRFLEKLTESQPSQLSFREASEEGVYELKIYKHGEILTLSSVLPLLENTGFNILNETVTPLMVGDSVWAAIYTLHVRPKTKSIFPEDVIDSIIVPGLTLILSGEAENDSLNQLLLNPGLTCREIATIRTLTMYLWQLKAFPSVKRITAATIKNPQAVRIITDYFDTKFNPQRFENAEIEREKVLSQLSADFYRELKSVHLLVQDQVLRALINVIDSTVRTNFYLHDDNYRIALKIDCKKIARIPKPVPYCEVFVSAPDFEGIHIRGGMIARGGLRWSERLEDFRTEVLGLMKTQMIKNSIIIPVGAKGGFILKKKPEDPEELGAAIKNAYKQFIRSLLEVTDNRIENKIVHPKRTIIYDDEDPYLVVAADRGTATFSDLANSIAVDEFDFWLGDAFASGGSNGFDHKQLGITARGAWQAVYRHFHEIGIDADKDSFTVVGIGDMAGDVFGNGLLETKTIKLIAAFNHKHIFIDPNPDPLTSYNERLRLFKLPRSDWSDYNEDLLSPGGGIYERSQKEIHLSIEAQSVLSVDKEILSADELLQVILKAPVDLLWNGGIGTFVKASSENIFDVDDRSNDDIRIDAKDLRVKVIGEGGNLGLTQQARIEYSKIGGHINIDAVDNSGGVSISDMEVNLKILLSAPVRRGDLSFEDRNDILSSCAEDICIKVIQVNSSQGKTLSLAVRRSRQNLDYYRALITDLEKDGLLDRKGEFLPDDETIKKRAELRAGLTRPELAILLGSTKMSLVNSILESSIPEDPYLLECLFSYFPETIVERFRDDILEHPLRREIIATQVVNMLIERMGIPFVSHTCIETGAAQADVIWAFLAADGVLKGREIINELEVLDKPTTARAHLSALMRVSGAVDSMTRWLLNNWDRRKSLDSIMEIFQNDFHILYRHTESLMTNVELSRFKESCKQLIINGFSKKVAEKVISTTYGVPYLDIVNIAKRQHSDVIKVAKLYFTVSVLLQIRELLERARDMESHDKWETMAARTIQMDLRKIVGLVTSHIISTSGEASSAALDDFFTERKESVDRFQNLFRELSKQPVTVPSLFVLSSQLYSLIKN